VRLVDYFAQVLEYLTFILKAFALVIHFLPFSAESLFMEDGNSAYGHKSTINCCAEYCTKHGIIFMFHFFISSHMNSIEKCWRWIKQVLHKLLHQSVIEAEMKAAVLEKWEAISQDWIN